MRRNGALKREILYRLRDLQELYGLERLLCDDYITSFCELVEDYFAIRFYPEDVKGKSASEWADTVIERLYEEGYQ